MNSQSSGASHPSTTSAPTMTVVTEPSSEEPASPTPISGPLPTKANNEPEEIRVIITAVGDVLMHKAVIDGGQTNPGEAEPQYDYTYCFQYVRPFFEKSDLAIGNIEGTLAGAPYTGFPYFSAPDEIADALYDVGFRVVCAANNHSIDKGLDGLIRTATVLREKGFTAIGTRPDEDSAMDAIVDVGGIRLGIMNYTWETIGTKTQKGINGIPLPKEADPLINSFNPSRSAAFEADIEALIDDVERLRRDGAEFICLMVHWGTEYTTQSAQWQQDMALRLCDAGVGLIIGNHPHVLQEIDVITSETTGNETLVYYSTGNFLGNWAYETLGTNGKAQDGMIARITLIKTKEGVSIEKGEYIPTFVVRAYEGSLLKHYIVPVIPAIDDPEYYRTTTAIMESSYKRIAKILGPCTGTKHIPIAEVGTMPE
ncbi:MAG: CapA family protein [Clostridiales bacterium]|nr:CapA family protein [Clostridiales bacterium]